MTEGVNPDIDAFIGFDSHDDKFIKVTNFHTNTYSYVSKSSLVIDQVNDSTFTITVTDTIVKWFDFIDVKYPYPIPYTPENVIIALERMVKRIHLVDDGNTAFSIIQSSDVIFEVPMTSDLDDNLDHTTHLDPNIGHTVDVLDGCVEMTSKSSEKVIRQSKEYISVPSGKTVVTLVSGRLIDDISASATDYTISRIGMFDDRDDIVSSYTSVVKEQHGNGLFFEYDTSKQSSTGDEINGLRICIRNNHTDNAYISQNDWNVDVADGYGYSTQTLDPTVMNTFVFKYFNMDKSSIQFGFMHDGEVIIVHEHSNSTDPSSFNFNKRMPIRWEIKTTGTTERSMKQSKAISYSDERSSKFPSSLSYSLDIPKNINNSSREILLFDMSLHELYLRDNMRISSVSISNSLDGKVRWKIIKNGDIYKMESFKNDQGVSSSNPTVSAYDGSIPHQVVSKASILSIIAPSTVSIASNGYDVTYANHLTIRGGTTVASGYALGNDVSTIDLSRINVFTSGISGISDRLSLVVYYIDNEAQLQCSLNWEE